MASHKPELIALQGGAGASANAPQRPVSEPAPPPRFTNEDREFLPAALEIIDTPPSPVSTALIWLFTLLVAAALIWGWLGHFDIVATAQGKIQPPGRVKVVQPLETGKVVRIAVRNGTAVREGDLLVAFDSTEARADAEALATQKAALDAEINRRAAAVNRGATPADATPVAVDWADDVPEGMRVREQRVLEADLAQLRAAIAALDAQKEQKASEHQRLADTIKAQAALVKNLQDRVDMRHTLARSGSGSQAAVIDAREALLTQEAVLTSERGQLRDTEAAIAALKAEAARQVQNFIADNTQKRAEATRTLDEVSQRLTKARARLERMMLTSPADGIVQASTLYTVGQVVGAGQEIMRIVPTGEKLEVEAYFPNKDIGFVSEGQSVVVKVDSFPYTRFGLLHGTVVTIARDAIPLPEAAQIEGNPVRPSENQTFAGAQRTQNLVFPVTIALEQSSLSIDGKMVPMTPGMTVTAEIKTGQRRILEYVFAPLVETTSEAMRER